MPAVRVIKTTVRAPEESFSFACRIHTASNRKEFLIDLAFYQQAMGVPAGVHHELELLDESVLKHKHRQRIHVRTSALNGRKFVCYPLRIADIGEVFRVFSIWSLGTTFTMVTGRDFQEIYNGDRESFVREMETTYGIEPSIIILTDKP